MASNGSTALLPGQSAPLTVITATDQTGIVLIATALSLTFAIVSLLIRVFIRLEFRHEFALDDLLAAFSAAFMVFQSSAVFMETSKGFGKAIDDIPLAHIIPLQKAAYSAEILYIITLWLTKCSVAFLYIRLSPDRRHNLMSYMILIASTLFMVISVFIVAFRCDISHPWIFIGEQCHGLLVRWQVVAAFNIVTEIALFYASIDLVKGLQVSLSKKLVVILAFGIRLLVVIPTGFRLHYLSVEFASADPTLHGVLASVCTEIELSYAIIAATIPCLRPFMAALSTNYGAPAPNETSTYAAGTVRSRNDYALNSIPTVSRVGKAKDSSTPKTRWDVSEHHASVMSGDQHSMESHESKQGIIAKHTDWAVEYETENSNHNSKEIS